MTLEEFLKNTLCKSGIQEAAGVEVTFKDGTRLSIHSDDHPALGRTIDKDDEPQVNVVQSAQGG